MYASIELKIYFLTIYCACNVLHALHFHKNGNLKHQILSSVYDVIKFNDKKMSEDNRGPSLMSAESMSKTTMNPNRRYSFEDYEYVDSFNDFAGAESNHEHHFKPHHEHQSHKNLVCYHNDKHHHTKVQHNSDEGIWNKLSTNIFTLFKFLAVLVGSFVAPVMLLKLLMLPLKIIFLLKFFALVNTFLIGSFLYRFFFRRGIDLFRVGWKNVKTNIQNNKNRPNQLIEEVLANNANGTEISEDDIRLILKAIKKKNKDW